MRILFQGLVCHTTIEVGGQKQRIAALPAATDHIAAFSYRLDDIPGSGLSGAACEDLAGCVDTSLGKGEASVVDIGDVPRLTKTTTDTTGHPSPELVKCPPSTSKIQSIFFLPPGGRLSRDFYFKDEAKFNGVNHGPMPQIVIYALNPATDVTFNLGGGVTVKLKPSAQVLIANVCSKTSTTTNHYQFYKNILDTTALSITVHDPVQSGTKCTFATLPPVLPDCIEGSTLDIDCVNSQFP